MKRVFSIFLMCLILTACQKEVDPTLSFQAETEADKGPNDLGSQLDNQDTSGQSEDQAPDPQKGGEDDTHGGQSLSGWAYVFKDLEEAMPYEEPVYQASMATYKWAADLSDLFNAGQYDQFTQGQMDLINKNGFVVMRHRDDWAYLKMHYGYEEAEYAYNPIFVTSDIVLHMYHTYYSETMKSLELLDYLPRLKTMTDSLLEISLEDYNEASDLVKEDLKHVVAYLGVAADLLEQDQDKKIPGEIQDMIDYEIRQIRDHKGRSDSLVFDKNVDYSQYIIRGHYTSHQDLGKYFLAMMWYGQTGLQLTSIEGVEYKSLRQSLMLTDILFRDLNNVRAWDHLYRLTKLYSGYSDDLNLIDMRDFILEVYGEDHMNHESYADEAYNPKILEAIKTLRSPKIQANIALTDIKVGLEYRLMGQRFTLDSYIMQGLMMPILRPEPTAFDVLSAMGHPVAEEILRANYTTNQTWPEYDLKLNELKEYVAEYGENYQSDLYNGWLWSIDAAARKTSDQGGLPIFMQNQAWDYKNITSALGSYAELKHDNVLYAKQAIAERGGDWFEEQEYHYVEPNVDLYNRLLWLASYTKANLLEGAATLEGDSLLSERGGQLNPLFGEPLDRMIDLLTLFKEVSIKELTGERVTDEEFRALRSVGGYIDYLEYQFSYELANRGMELSPKVTSALISDVATVFSDSFGDTYLEEATGLPYEIYVVCQVNGKTFLAKGYVYSYYEFWAPERLTDDQWAQMIGVIKTDYDYSIYGGPGLHMTDRMPWTKLYVSDEPNHVSFDMVELSWSE